VDELEQAMAGKLIFSGHSLFEDFAVIFVQMSKSFVKILTGLQNKNAGYLLFYQFV